MNKPGTTRRNGTVRCAIYTRKSSEDGHQQKFNCCGRSLETEGDVDGRRAASRLSGSGPQAELVRSIFRRYAELGSVPLLRDELDQAAGPGAPV
jgi:hypothetical protein